jgi:hypothetical protein
MAGPSGRGQLHPVAHGAVEHYRTALDDAHFEVRGRIGIVKLYRHEVARDARVPAHRNEHVAIRGMEQDVLEQAQPAFARWRDAEPLMASPSKHGNPLKANLERRATQKECPEAFALFGCAFPRLFASRRRRNPTFPVVPTTRNLEIGLAAGRRTIPDGPAVNPTAQALDRVPFQVSSLLTQFFPK